MFDPQVFVRPHILNMPAYEPILPFEVLSEQLGLPAREIIKLDANENPYGPHPAVLEALAKMPYPHIYPDPGSRSLRQALSRHLDVPEESLLTGAGADELIDLLLRLVIEPGDVVLNCPPTFGMYAFDSDLNGARLVSLPRKTDFSLDLPAIERAIQDHHPKIIFLASPNNPDGSLIPASHIEQLLSYPILVALDEAYIEFAFPGTSLIRRVAASHNLVVLRTFSKWAGLAGLRVGYAAFPSGLLPHLWKIKQPYNVSVAASTAAQVSLLHAGDLERTGQKIVEERQRLYQELKSIHWLEPYPSQANFILCRVRSRDAATVKQELARRGILVRYFNKPGLADHIRVSVGKPEHTQALIAALRSLEVGD